MACPRVAPTLNFGSFGLKALEPERITARQIESARRAITRAMKRAGRVWIRIFPDVPVSTKPAEVRMGSGKGSPEFWVARVAPGRIMFEIDGVTPELAREALTLGAAKLPIKDQVHRPDRRRLMAKNALYKASDVRAKTPDELSGLLLDLRKEQFNLRFQRATGQQEGTGRVREVSPRDRSRENHPGGKDSFRRQVVRREGDAKARPDRAGDQRQDGQDHYGSCRSSRDAPAVQEVHPQVEEVRGARRGERVQDRRHGPHRRMRADQQAEDLDPGRAQRPGRRRRARGSRRHRRGASGAARARADGCKGDGP